MNGNVKLVDNAKDWQGKHKRFIQLQDEPTDYLQTNSVKSREAFDVWVFLKRRSGSEYNATINNIARDLHMRATTVTWAQEYLIKVGLLKIEEEAELTGEKRLVTETGITVKNNKAQYTVYATSEQIIALMSKQTAAVASPAAVVEEVPQAQQIQTEVVKVVASPAAVSPSRDERLKAREEEIKEIGRRYSLSVQRREELVLATKKFASSVKRKASDAEINHMANLLSCSENDEVTGSKAVSDFIWRKALSK